MTTLTIEDIIKNLTDQLIMEMYAISSFDGGETTEDVITFVVEYFIKNGWEAAYKKTIVPPHGFLIVVNRGRDCVSVQI
jgi:hypothetical protein